MVVEISSVLVGFKRCYIFCIAKIGRVENVLDVVVKLAKYE